MQQGIKYELFVQRLMQAILSSENEGGQKNIVVRHNENISDRFGIKRQFDVLWEYEQGGITYKTVIECKDYNQPVSIEKIDALLGKLADFPAVRGIIATTKGYQSGAIEKAKNNGIELLCIREQNDSDWTDSDGTPLIKKVVSNITAIHSAEIIQCDRFLDKKYIEEKSIDPQKINFSQTLNTDLYIDDLIRKETYSLYDLQQKIANKNDDYGEYEKEILFENAYIFNKDIRVKLKKLKVKYRILPPTTTFFEIDFSQYITGVVEYLLQGKKKTILKDGSIRNEKSKESPT